MVPNYLVLNGLGLMDSHWALILPGCFSAFSVFVMARGFDAVPRALLEAAAIDGAGPFVTFWRIGLPLGVPGILSALVLAFLEGWNAIEQPMTFLKDPALWPLSLYLSSAGRAGTGGGHGRQPGHAGPRRADLPLWPALPGAGHPGQRPERIAPWPHTVRMLWI